MGTVVRGNFSVQHLLELVNPVRSWVQQDRTLQFLFEIHDLNNQTVMRGFSGYVWVSEVDESAVVKIGADLFAEPGPAI